MFATSPKLTNAGISLQVRAAAGEAINFTRFKVGNGTAASGAKPAEYDDLLNPIISFGITSAETEATFLALTGQFDNSEVTTDFNWTELGLFCEDSDGTEYLYAYAYDNDRPGKIVAASDVLLVETVEVAVAIGSAEHVTATLTEASTYATKASVESHTSNVNNPHNVTKDQVGLSEVQNVAVDNMSPTVGAKVGEWYENIGAGLTFSGLMRKIKDGFSRIWAHMTDVASHCGVGEKNYWNAKAAGDHKHNASDVNSGILSVLRGGTGLDNHYIVTDVVNPGLIMNSSKKSARVKADSIATGYGYLVMATVTMSASVVSDVHISLSQGVSNHQTAQHCRLYTESALGTAYYASVIGYVACKDNSSRPEILIRVNDSANVNVSNVTFVCLRLFAV